MEIVRINSRLTAFIRPDEGSNVGLIHTSDGMIIIDTTSYPQDVKALFQSLEVQVGDVRLVLNTHFHSDHTWGNQVFTCPILAQRLCRELMQSSLKNDWSTEEIDAYISELQKTDPTRAAETREKVAGLQITLPDQIFDEHYEQEIGGLQVEAIHLGGHTPDLSVIWLPEAGVLYASDLIFQGRYPYIFDGDIPVWISQLSRLLEFDADVIIPGHGVICGEAEVIALRDYLQGTWELTSHHVHLGHTAQETAGDPAFPVYAAQQNERLHLANIHYIYRQLTS